MGPFVPEMLTPNNQDTGCASDERLELVWPVDVDIVAWMRAFCTLMPNKSEYRQVHIRRALELVGLADIDMAAQGVHLA